MSYGWRPRRRAAIMAIVMGLLVFGLPTSPSSATIPVNLSVSVGSASIVASAHNNVTMYFPVTLSQPASSTVTVTYRTQPGSAPATWYTPASGTLTFPVSTDTGLTGVEQFVTVRVSQDAAACTAHAFSVKLLSVSGATIGNQVGLGTISCETPTTPQASVGGVKVYDGSGGPSRMVIVPVTLSKPAPTPVTVHYAITGVTAVQPTNYSAPAANTVTIPTGAVQGAVAISVVSGSVNNPAKTLTVTLTGASGATIGKASSVVTIAPELQPLLFDDEFNGTSLDLSKWQPNWLGASNASITKPVNTEELSCYAPSQVTEPGDGYLHLNAARRSCKASNGVTYSMASGLVETRKHFTFTYGYMEARIWLPTGTSATKNWPAFWAAGTGVWPAAGELDVMEGLEGVDCYHFHSSLGAPGRCVPLAIPSGWHTFGARWAPGSVTYFYDGREVGQITTGITNVPMYLILNQGIGVGDLNGTISLPSTMLVDYVRVSR